jgi:tRNA G10  N-methylase Trm11
LIYEILKPFSSAITIKSPNKGLQDYHLQLTTISSSKFNIYRDLFYTHFHNEEEYLRKDVLKETIGEQINWESLAYWIMDDGKSRGGKYCFSLCIGVQDHYTDDRVEKFVGILSDTLGLEFKWKKERISYSIHVLSKDSAKVKKNLLPYIFPDFHYKFKVHPDECGEVYRGLDWFKLWGDKRLNIEHPFLKKMSYKEYITTSNKNDKKRYEISLFNRTIARGFPYIRHNEEDLYIKWRSIQLCDVSVSEDKILTCTPTVNSFSNHYMNHRYHCRKINNYSPHSVFIDRKKLKKTLALQLASGPNINNTNIRNALSSYSSSGLGVFNTGIAKYLINKYSINDFVLDPCAGWGNRLCAASSLGKNYYGIEPSTRTFYALNEIKSKLKEYGVVSDIDIVNGVAEDSLNYKDSIYGCCITSPPYYNLEVYSDEDTQSFKRHPSYRVWLEGFLKVMINNVHRALVPGGFFVLNVGKFKSIDLVKDTRDLCLGAGFIYIHEYSLKPFMRPGMKNHWSEPVMIFKKEPV